MIRREGTSRHQNGMLYHHKRCGLTSKQWWNNVNGFMSLSRRMKGIVLQINDCDLIEGIFRKHDTRQVGQGLAALALQEEGLLDGGKWSHGKLFMAIMKESGGGKMIVTPLITSAVWKAVEDGYMNEEWRNNVISAIIQDSTFIPFQPEIFQPDKLSYGVKDIWTMPRPRPFFIFKKNTISGRTDEGNVALKSCSLEEAQVYQNAVLSQPLDNTFMEGQFTSEIPVTCMGNLHPKFNVPKLAIPECFIVTDQVGLANFVLSVGKKMNEDPAGFRGNKFYDRSGLTRPAMSPVKNFLSVKIMSK